jgi:signal transduction histidine kinase
MKANRIVTDQQNRFAVIFSGFMNIIDVTYGKFCLQIRSARNPLSKIPVKIPMGICNFYRCVLRSMQRPGGVFYLLPILLLIWALAFWMPVLAQSSDPVAPEPIILTNEKSEYPLGLHLEILEDPSGELTIDQVSSPEFASQFIPSQVEVPNFGMSDSAYWVRLRLDNQTAQNSEWLLEQGFANTHFVDFYTPLPDGNGFAVKQTGILRPISTRDVFHPRIILRLTIPPKSQQTYYLRFQTGGSLTLPLTLWTQAAFLDKSVVELIFTGLFYGVLIGLLFFHLFLLISLREANYVFFTILLTSLVVEAAVYDGYWRLFITPNLELIHTYFHQVTYSILIVSLLLFSDTFLELKERLPILHRVHLIIMAVWGALMLLIPFTSYHFIARLMAFLAVISLLAVLMAGFILWKGGFQPARFFTIAWFGMVVSLLLLMLVRLGWISSTFLSENVYRLGFVWMAVCWSIALADRINLLKAETENTNRKLQNSERRLSQILDGLPLGVVLYGKDQKPRYANQRTFEIFTDPARGIQPDISTGRTLAQAIPYFSLRVAGDLREYPLENFPVFSALQGEPASADDIEMDRGDSRVALEILASPVRDNAGNVESAVVAIQDITRRKQWEAELAEYYNHLNEKVEIRTKELSAANEQLQLRLEWLSAVNMVNQVMARSADFFQIFENIIEIINKLLSAQDSFIAEWVPGTKQLTILAHSYRGDLHPALNGSVTSLPDTFLSDADIEQGNPTIYSKDQLEALSGPIGMHFRTAPVHSLVLVPLRLRERLSGFLGLEFHEKERIITQDEANLLSIFSVDIAQLIEDSHLIEQAKALILAEERNRLARDLHDSVTQVLFSANLLADVLPQIWRRDPEQGLQKLDKLRTLTRGALAEMRAMLLELRPTAVINTPLGDLLTQLAEAITSRSGLPFQLFIEQIPILPENVQVNLYRIAQEALNNVVKHAQAKQVTMILSATPLIPGSTSDARQEVKLVIEDDGVGFVTDRIQPDQLGIGIMYERAAAIQASLSLESQPGHGTQVTIIWCN